MSLGGLGLAVGKGFRVQGLRFRGQLDVGEGFEVKGVKRRVLGFGVLVMHAIFPHSHHKSFNAAQDLGCG